MLPEIPDVIFPRRFLPILVEQSVILANAVGMPGFGMAPVVDNARPPGGFQQVCRLQGIISEACHAFPANGPDSPVANVPHGVKQQDTLLIAYIQNILILPGKAVNIVFRPGENLGFKTFFAYSSNMVKNDAGIDVNGVPVQIHFSLPA